MIIISEDSESIRVIRSRKAEWVTFGDEEDAQNKKVDIEHSSDNRLLSLHLDMRTINSVEINFTKRKKFLCSQNLKSNLEELEQSGFYFGKRLFPLEICTKLLEGKPVGTFLIRDSSDSNYLYTLSVQTERGPTSVRLVYDDGLFRLDAADHRLIGVLPGFKSVLELTQYYVDFEKNSKKREVVRSRSLNSQVWIDSVTGRTHSAVKLTRPLRKQVPTLKHLCRLNLNKNQCDTTYTLPESLYNYLKEYPFPL